MAEVGFFGGFLIGSLAGLVVSAILGYILIKRKLASITADALTAVKGIAVDQLKTRGSAAIRAAIANKTRSFR